MNPIRPTSSYPSTSSHSLPQPSTSSGATTTHSKLEDIRERLRQINCEPQDIAGMRQDLLSSVLLPPAVSTIMSVFKKRVIKAKHIDNVKRDAFLSAIAEAGKPKKSATEKAKRKKQTGKKKNITNPFPNISKTTLIRIQNDPSEINMRSLLSCMSRAKVHIKDVPLCLVILTKAKVNRGKITSSCYKYKRSTNHSVHLKSEDKRTICEQMDFHLKQLEAKALPDLPADAESKKQSIKETLLDGPLSLEDLVEARYNLKMLGETPLCIGKIMHKYKRAIKDSYMTEEEKYHHLANAKTSTNLVRVKLAEQTMHTPIQQKNTQNNPSISSIDEDQLSISSDEEKLSIYWSDEEDE